MNKLASEVMGDLIGSTLGSGVRTGCERDTKAWSKIISGLDIDEEHPGHQGYYIVNFKLYVRLADGTVKTYD